MYQLLIVDDEKQTREGIKRLLEWQDYGIEICGEAGNGQEALKIIERQRPDIILLDIQMPVMNGLELAKIIHAGYQECKFIVLSGYDDFALVRQAMKYGAVDYLLKPSGKEEIIQTIEEIIDTLEDRIISKLQNNEHLALLKNNVLNRMINGTISSRELRDKLELLELDFSKGPFAVASVEIAQTPDSAASAEIDQAPDPIAEDDISRQIFGICNICEGILKKSGRGLALTDSSGRVSMILMEYSGWSSDERLNKLLKRCILEVKKHMNLEITISVGNQVCSSRKMCESYRNALSTMSYRFIFGIGNVLYCDEIKEYFEKAPGFIRIDGEHFKELIKEGSLKEAGKYVRELFLAQIRRDPLAEIYVLKNSALELSVLAFQCLAENAFIDQNEIYDMKNQVLAEIMLQTSPEDVSSHMLDILRKVIGLIGSSREKTLSKPVFDSIQYIERNYTDPDLSLQYLDDDFHISTAYLGKLFKKEIGSNFNDYLNTYRIRKAEKLLVSTNYKGIELAEKVGFASYNYFYIVFKKVTGQKPMDIRKNALGDV